MWLIVPSPRYTTLHWHTTFFVYRVISYCKHLHMYRCVYSNNNKGPIRRDIEHRRPEIYACSKQTCPRTRSDKFLALCYTTLIPMCAPPLLLQSLDPPLQACSQKAQITLANCIFTLALFPGPHSYSFICGESVETGLSIFGKRNSRKLLIVKEHTRNFSSLYVFISYLIS